MAWDIRKKTDGLNWTVFMKVGQIEIVIATCPNPDAADKVASALNLYETIEEI